MSRNGIPTTYRDTRFRSRLEARWACFFDLLEWRWEYEPFDADGYVPDFVLLGELPVLVEAKPATSLEELSGFIGYVDAGTKGHWDKDALLVGVSPFLAEDHWWWQPCGALGLLRDGDWLPGKSGAEVWDNAQWCSCRDCGAHAFFHSVHSFATRPCGHRDGDHHLDEPHISKIETFWATARNTTQWRAA